MAQYVMKHRFGQDDSEDDSGDDSGTMTTPDGTAGTDQSDTSVSTDQSDYVAPNSGVSLGAVAAGIGTGLSLVSQAAGAASQVVGVGQQAGLIATPGMPPQPSYTPVLPTTVPAPATSGMIFGLPPIVVLGGGALILYMLFK